MRSCSSICSWEHTLGLVERYLMGCVLPPSVTASVAGAGKKSPSPNRLEQLFHFEEQPGSGAFSDVQAVRAVVSHAPFERGQRYAVKSLTCGYCKKQSICRIAYRERGAMRIPSHPFVMNLLAAFYMEHPELGRWLLATQLCPGGTCVVLPKRISNFLATFSEAFQRLPSASRPLPELRRPPERVWIEAWEAPGSPWKASETVTYDAHSVCSLS